MATLYVLLIPAIGYICLHKLNKLKIKTKPVSGLELTYQSAIYGGVFITVSYLLICIAGYFFVLDYSDQAKPFLPYLLSDISQTKISYFILAAVLSWLYSLVFIKTDILSWDGDSILGRVWYDLLFRETIVVLFLKNGKCYQGQLVEVEVSERVTAEDRPVTLYVILSGYRNSEGVVDWNTSYQTPLRHHFMMSEIVNFSEYSASATFKIGSKKKNTNRKT